MRAIAEVSKVIKEVNEDSPKIRRELARLAKTGGIRPEYRGQMSRFSPIERSSSAIHKADTASRIILNRWFDRLVKEGIAKNTKENRYRFVSQMGEYNRLLMPKLEANLRDWGLSPFIVAGRNFNRFSRRLITGNPGFETTGARAGLNARFKMMSGIIYAGLFPVVINEILNGTPFGRKGNTSWSLRPGPKVGYRGWETAYH